MGNLNKFPVFSIYIIIIICYYKHVENNYRKSHKNFLYTKFSKYVIIELTNGEMEV